ncbi:Ger(x)C family spore germination protein [Paenibacillus lemnae]|uniref:Ger(X)C family spore germination protein n=1 Tax=Paenibacillus lemnae TaxID=1330551 RepID=A0A848MCP7_PAELE|nr:Ger(x)C family spore germination protein [Paenibacillus lemnae]NMO97843.1 Ger(x)C family spore germination protein [Paenibacillus lemnae]
MNKLKFAQLGMLMVMLFTVSGCWDHEYLKDINLAYSVAFDLSEDGNILETVEIIVPAESEQSSPKNEIHHSTGLTPRNASTNMRNIIRGNMRFIKFGVQMVGTELAKKGLKTVLDVNFRDPSNPTADPRFVVADGLASDIISKKLVGEIKIGEFLQQKIRSLERMGIFYPPETINSVFLATTNPGKDFVLPYLGIENEEVVAKGVALFDDEYFTGTLDTNQSTLLVLMSGEMGDNARMTRKLHITEPYLVQGDISFNLAKKKPKRKFKIHVHRNGEVSVDLHLKTYAVIEEFTGDQQLKVEILPDIQKRLSEMLTEEADSIISTLKQSNCDLFGVGRHLIAYHNKLWQTKNWDEEYRTLQFNTTIDVEIISTGVLI